MDDKSASPEPSAIQFHYIKSNGFRVVHCDGVYGGRTPTGLITASIFSERLPIPQESTYQVDSAGKLGAEIIERRVQRKGIVREVDVEIIMDIRAAKNMAEWLLRQIEAAKVPAVKNPLPQPNL